MKLKKKPHENLVKHVELTQFTQDAINWQDNDQLIYLLHFKQPLERKGPVHTTLNTLVKHYIGMSNNIVRRMYEHSLGARGGGLNLVQKAMSNGGVILIDVWPYHPKYEREMKNCMNHKAFCRICRWEGRQPNTRMQRIIEKYEGIK